MVTSSDSSAAGLVALLGLLGLAVGFLLFLAIATRHALAVPVAVIEGKGGREAARRSKQLLKQALGHGTGYSMVYSVYFLLFVVGVSFLVAVEFALMILAIPDRISSWFAGSWMKPILVQIVELAPLYLVVWALVPAWAASLTVIYYERRVRLEGYDIEALGRQTNEDRASRFNV
jgi:hypothetical protein